MDRELRTELATNSAVRKIGAGAEKKKKNYAWSGARPPCLYCLESCCKSWKIGLFWYQTTQDKIEKYLCPSLNYGP